MAKWLPMMALAFESRVRATPTLGEFPCQNSYFPTTTQNCSVATAANTELRPLGG